MMGIHAMCASATRRLALPVAVYPGLALTGACVQEVVAQPGAQVAAALAIHRRCRTPALLSAMDLSVEAEAFGCQIHMTPDEIPTAVGSLVTTLAQAEALVVPLPGAGRTQVYLETVRRLRATEPAVPVLGGMIGPFSLAGRLTGLSEACGLTLTEPELMHLLLRKSAEYLGAYALAFKQAGASGIIMAEPAAGLLSPKAVVEFSSTYIRQIVNAVGDDGFEVILHNCGAKLLHLSAILEAGARIYHFGKLMDLARALEQVPKHIVLCGNLDPTGVFHQGTPAEIHKLTTEMLHSLREHRNFVVSSGCDVPPGTPLANLDAFFEAVAAEPAFA